MRGTWTANLEFKDMLVPEENILGPLGKGLKVCLTVLDFGRTTFGSTCTGTAKELVENAVRHAKSRYQFKRPLASFAMIKKKIALMSAYAFAMEASTYLTAGFIDNDLEDFMLESAILKVFASDAQWQILFDTMQTFGGRSFFTDQPYERMMRDARLNMIGEGANEVLRAFIAGVGLRDVGMELKGAADAFKSFFRDYAKVFKEAGSLLGRLSAPQVPVRSPRLKSEAVALSKIIRRLSLACVRVLATYGEDIIEKQLQLDRLTSTAIAIYTTTAVISRLDRELALPVKDEEQLKRNLAIGKFYCRHSMQTADCSLKGINANNDDQIDKLSDLITGLKSYEVKGT
jgi:alkylation response protein AidB-like acyl-CoA dehydrogenase